MKNFKKILSGIILGSLVLAAAPAGADYLPGEKTRAEQVDSVDMVLSYLTIEQFAPSRLEFRKLSPDAVADLVTISKRSSYEVGVRARAIQSLALYGDDERAVETIDGLMKRHRAGQRIFPAVLVAYAQIHGESVAAEIGELAAHSREDVRMAAVVALGRFGGQVGHERLMELQETEEDSHVLARINTYIR